MASVNQAHQTHTSLLPIVRMWERAEQAREDSDTAFFIDLLYLGELILKAAVAALVGAVADDRERHRYRQLHRLVRADGLGEWAAALDDVLTGPAAQNLLLPARDEQRELIQRVGRGEWQFDAFLALAHAILVLDPTFEVPQRVDGRRWFHTFVALRNATRGHGATTASACSVMAPHLEKSLRLVADNFGLFRRQWAYLHRNLSGKYRVTRLTDDASLFSPLQSTRDQTLTDGVYVYFDRPAFVELIKSNVDASDFLLANGGFTDKRFELLSYTSGNKAEGDSTRYLAPAGELPPSETQGIGILDAQGESLGNLPPVRQGYVRRAPLENALHSVLTNDRHPVVTLVGRGGIGKTYLALHVLHEIAATGQFTAILWFSARDIDLLPSGPKLVRPHVLTEADMAAEFARLTEPQEVLNKSVKPVDHLSRVSVHGVVAAYGERAAGWGVALCSAWTCLAGRTVSRS